jgi:hypothetical protein
MLAPGSTWGVPARNPSASQAHARSQQITASDYSGWLCQHPKEGVGVADAQQPLGGRIDTEANVSQQKSEYRDATPVLLLKHTDTTLTTYSEGYIQIKNENTYT